MRARLRIACAVLIVSTLLTAPALAGSFFFSTGNPDGKVATGSRPGSPGLLEIESADDFVLTEATKLTSATFTGLLPTNASLQDILDVRIEIYRDFPKDSDVSRTSGPPTFSTPQVPTRVNSPADNELDDRSASAHTLTFTPGIIQSTFSANNSVLNGIHPKPGFNTGGDGPVSGQEVQFNVVFTTPFTLLADHYFFVPQVQLASGDFLWLSAPRPIVPPGTPFPPGFTDLQEWIRNENLAPDWLRVGTDIVGGTTFNASFSLAGQTVPEPTSLTMLALGTIALFAITRAAGRRRAALS
jgi:hypothetical protein